MTGWHNVNNPHRCKNVNPHTCPIVLIADKITKWVWLRELPSNMKNQFLLLVNGVSLQMNSLPQLPINNHVRTMLHVATHGLNHLLNKCVINNTFRKPYLPAAKTLGLGKNFLYKALIIKFRLHLTLHLLLT